MEQEKSRIPIRKRLTGPTAATVGFLIVAGLFLYACVSMLAGILRREIVRAKPDAPTPSPSASAAIWHASAEPVLDVAAILVPDEPAHDATTPLAGDTTPHPSELPVDTPVPTPAQTPLPQRTARPLQANQAEFALLGYDATGRADWIVLVEMQGGVCRVLSVPRNTLSAKQTTLSQLASTSRVLEQLCDIWPVRQKYSIDLQLSGLSHCIDLLGGITLDAKPYTGEQAVAWLKSAGSDELLRIARQQQVMRACLAQLHATSSFKLIAAKFSLEKYLTTNLSTTQLITLFLHFKRMSLDEITFATLPVDSIMLENARCYTPDVSLVNRMLSQ